MKQIKQLSVVPSFVNIIELIFSSWIIVVWWLHMASWVFDYISSGNRLVSSGNKPLP